MARRKRSSPPSGWRTPGIAQRIACMQGIKKRGCGIHTQEIQRTLFFGSEQEKKVPKQDGLVGKVGRVAKGCEVKRTTTSCIYYNHFIPPYRAQRQHGSPKNFCMHSVKAAHPKPTGTVIPRVRYDTRMRIPNKQLCVSATNRDVTEDLT
ncbi:hypothetical protein MCOR12_007259 [Pyricularia oryzae]|nr:hypothetical protein MCOR01_011104 [Pyricularia oryzae]KAI6406181.1 hypothetical protein MCOR20_006280 [Pyricularia oryzae]KAI6593556.1 hypothetical protein MCOR12_007259 [Pyricularia oryzae]